MERQELKLSKLERGLTLSKGPPFPGTPGSGSSGGAGRGSPPATWNCWRRLGVALEGTEAALTHGGLRPQGVGEREDGWKGRTKPS